MGARTAGSGKPWLWLSGEEVDVNNQASNSQVDLTNSDTDAEPNCLLIKNKKSTTDPDYGKWSGNQCSYEIMGFICQQPRQ